jgi:hypothetical protein
LDGRLNPGDRIGGEIDNCMRRPLGGLVLTDLGHVGCDLREPDRAGDRPECDDPLGEDSPLVFSPLEPVLDRRLEVTAADEEDQILIEDDRRKIGRQTQIPSFGEVEFSLHPERKPWPRIEHRSQCPKNSPRSARGRCDLLR